MVNEVKFYFMNENISLFNTDKLNIWYKVEMINKSVEVLELTNEATQLVNGNNINVKMFKNAELRFDKEFGKFQHGESGQILLNCCDKEIPEELLKLI